jgi:Ser/Thr protein kinase RdoA (MazF antagonist)
MTVLAYVPHVAGLVPDGRQTLVALDALHAALATVDVELPLLGPAMADLDLATAFAIEQDLLSAADGADLLARRDDVARALLDAAPERLALHGDAFPRNTVVANGRVVWLDFEDACRGPAAWDHGVLVRATDDPGVAAELARRSGPEVLRLAMELREVQSDVWRRLHDARRDGRLAAQS